jgi:hypothetical protein
MSKYEERVAQREREMIELYNADRTWSSHAIKGQFIDFARLCVQREADSFRQGIQTGLFGEPDGSFIHHMNESKFNELLIERGLIPPQTQTT